MPTVVAAEGRDGYTRWRGGGEAAYVFAESVGSGEFQTSCFQVIERADIAARVSFTEYG